jgi:hypothetical protein
MHLFSGSAGTKGAQSYLVNMRHLYLLIAAAAATMFATACGASAPAPVQAPPRAIDVETRVAPSPRRRDLPPPLVAPPPAYGNKIVMAQRDTTSTVH